MRCAAACLLSAWLAIAVTLAIGRGAECASPVSKTLSGAVQRANEQPGTGYIVKPRQ